jgi:hypothetical protein
MRPEMPATALVSVVLLAGGRFRRLLDLPRDTVIMVVGFGAYLVVLGISSAFIAPGTGQSLRMVAWLAISMLGGVVAFVLLRPKPADAIAPLAATAAVMGGLGILAAVLFLLLGPDFTLGIQETDSPVPRVYALGWETNLYASFLGMCSFFALEVVRGRRRSEGVAMLALILVGFALGITRGAYLGLAVGALAYVGIRLVAERRIGDVARLGGLSAGLLAVGVLAASALLPNALERRAADGRPDATSAPSSAASGGPGGTPGMSPGGPSGGPVGTPGSPAPVTPAPTIEPIPSLRPTDDTLAFRLERVPIALRDIPNSPLIGFGAQAFGQRHPDRHAGAGPDHIAILAIAVPYESGIAGSVGLAIGFAFLLRSLWGVVVRARRDRDWRAAGAAAAFIGSIVSILVAYQGNNALHLAINWIVFGAAAALAVTASRAARPVADPEGGV